MSYASKQDVIQSASKLYQGWIHGDTLYFKEGLGQYNTEATVLHEYVHWYRRKEGLYKYRTKKDQFVEEYIAENVSNFFMHMGHIDYKDILQIYRLDIDVKKAKMIAQSCDNHILSYVQ